MTTVRGTSTSDGNEVMQCADKVDQVRCLIDFLEPVTSLQTNQERFDKYQKIWRKLNPNVKTEWLSHVSVNYPCRGWKKSRVLEDSAQRNRDKVQGSHL